MHVLSPLEIIQILPRITYSKLCLPYFCQTITTIQHSALLQPWLPFYFQVYLFFLCFLSLPSFSSHPASATNHQAPQLVHQTPNRTKAINTSPFEPTPTSTTSHKQILTIKPIMPIWQACVGCGYKKYFSAAVCDDCSACGDWMSIRTHNGTQPYKPLTKAEREQRVQNWLNNLRVGQQPPSNPSGYGRGYVTRASSDPYPKRRWIKGWVPERVR